MLGQPVEAVRSRFGCWWQQGRDDQDPRPWAGSGPARWVTDGSAPPGGSLGPVSLGQVSRCDLAQEEEPNWPGGNKFLREYRSVWNVP